MSKKIVALFLVFATATCLACGCHAEKDKPVETVVDVTSAPTPTLEVGNDTDITAADFDIDTIKAGDVISVFTVTSADIKKNQDGTLSSAEIKFSGSLAVRGTYSISGDSENKECFFVFTEEYKEFLPFPKDVAYEMNGLYVNASEFMDIYGENTEGSAAIVIEEYSLNYSSENGEWKASADSFSKDENEYVIMQ